MIHNFAATRSRGAHDDECVVPLGRGEAARGVRQLPRAGHPHHVHVFRRRAMADERVEPLYGSIGASVAADRQLDVADATLSWRGMSAQLTRSFGRDNLGQVASILTTNSRVAGANLAVPVAVDRVGGGRNKARRP